MRWMGNGAGKVWGLGLAALVLGGLRFHRECAPTMPGREPQGQRD